MTLRVLQSHSCRMFLGFVVRSSLATALAVPAHALRRLPGLLILACLLPSCVPERVGGDRSPDEVIHELRREKASLTDAVGDLERRIESWLAQIAELEGRLADGAVAVEGVTPGDLPRLVQLRFGRYSAAVDSDDDGRDDQIRLFVLTLDQKERFIPVAGRADIQAVEILTDVVPFVVASRALTPDELDRAYRSSFMGTHYRLDLPLPADLATAARSVTVKVSFTDGATGSTVSHEQPMVINEGKASSTD